jgi:cytochrome c peroxidase
MMNKTGYTLFIHSAAAAMYLLTASGGFAQNGVVPGDRPDAPGALSQIRVPLPDLTGYVVDRQAAIVLGKAFFWDQQSGSDGLGCASCHFHAGADNRVKNVIDPGLRNTSTAAVQNTFDPMGSGKRGGPNNTVTRADFPFHRLADTNDRNSAVQFDTNDITGSQGVFSGIFAGMKLDSTTKQSEVCASSLSSTFSVGGINTRAVEPRNTPTVINAIFNFRNFWDGRANNIFNGRNPFGMRDPSAGINPTNSVMVADASGNLSPMIVAIADASLASQAVGPPGSNLEMSCDGRGFENIGQKLLLRNASTGAPVTIPLSGQTVSPTDSVLGPYAGAAGKGLVDPVTKAPIGYEALIKKAFDPKFWSSASLTDNGTYRQIEKNFSLFWGLAIASYESTLVSDDSPFDRYANGNKAALTDQQAHGFQVFNGNGNCVFCHRSAEFTGAATTLKLFQQSGSLVEQMQMSDGGVALYDSGSYNIGVRPTGDDIGVGGTDNWGNPLSWARQLTNYLVANPSLSTAGSITGVGLDQISVATCSFQADACQLDSIKNPDGTFMRYRDAIDGSFKVPTLRNVELTGPYFHNGGQATLEQVVDFYNRGGDGAGNDTSNTSAFGPNQTNRAPAILPLNLSDIDKAALVAFLKALTDDRVRYEKAPFDHPSLSVPNGHPFDQNSVLRNGTTPYAMDSIMIIPAVGAAGRGSLGAIGAFDAGLGR